MAGICATVRSQRRHRYSRQVISAHFSLAPKSRFPETETARGRDSVRMPVYAEGSPSIWCCRDHSAGMSARRATPMPRGSRPAMAAFTRSGARKASEIVMLTFRMLHRSRLAMLSAFAFASARSSSSQRRPRAIDATRSARDSERIGRACCGGSPAGRRISRRRGDDVLRHRTFRMLPPLAL